MQSGAWPRSSTAIRPALSSTRPRVHPCPPCGRRCRTSKPSSPIPAEPCQGRSQNLHVQGSRSSLSALSWDGTRRWCRDARPMSKGGPALVGKSALAPPQTENRRRRRRRRLLPLSEQHSARLLGTAFQARRASARSHQAGRAALHQLQQRHLLRRRPAAVISLAARLLTRRNRWTMLIAGSGARATACETGAIPMQRHAVARRLSPFRRAPSHSELGDRASNARRAASETRRALSGNALAERRRFRWAPPVAS